MMTKFTMAFFTAGIVGGVLLTDARRYLKSPWLWGGVVLSLVVFLPNMLWHPTQLHLAGFSSRYLA
jgi:4-amino-4-deoxy-L-arabinose transferase-like glycosyltransferase